MVYIPIIEIVTILAGGVAALVAGVVGGSFQLAARRHPQPAATAA